MAENRDHLIDIGDPEDDAPAPTPAGAAPAAPHVVIEYRDRGLPWMLLLPLLVAASAVAVIGYKAFDRTVRPSLFVPLDPIPAPFDPDTPETAQADAPKPGPSAPLPSESPKIPVVADHPPVPAQPTEPTPPAVAEHAEPAPAEPPAVAAAPAPVAEAPQPEPFLAPGFRDDMMAALERAEVKPEPAPAPPAVPPAADPAQPRGPDPKLLPPDPVQGMVERRQRFLAEIQRQNAARAQFHAELKATLARFRRNDKNFREIVEDLCRRYGTEPNPAAREMAEFKLTRQAAGVAGSVRVAILRELGWPEAAILRDLVAVRGRHEDGTARGGPRSYEDVLRQCSLELLRYPPKPAGPPTARAVNAGPRASSR